MENGKVNNAPGEGHATRVSQEEEGRAGWDGGRLDPRVGLEGLCDRGMVIRDRAPQGREGQYRQ